MYHFLNTVVFGLIHTLHNFYSLNTMGMTHLKVSDRSCKENQNTHFMFKNVFPKTFRLLGNVEKL
jgi:hypothetical protein